MKPRELGLIAVGQRHPRSLDGEGAEFVWVKEWLELTMTFQNSTPYENQAVESGIFEVALNVIDHIPFLCFRIFQTECSGSPVAPPRANLVLPWQECPFHLIQVRPDKLPAFDHVLQNPSFQLPITAILTDLETARVRAFQHFYLSPFFSRSLAESLLQSFPKHTLHSYPRAVDGVFARYPMNAIGDTARIRCRSEK